MMVAGSYCTSCGYENAPQRSACLLCYKELVSLEGGPACPQCGAANPSTANFCHSCGNAFAEGIQAAPKLATAAAVIAGVVSGTVPRGLSSASGLTPAAQAEEEEPGHGFEAVGEERAEAAPATPAPAATRQPTPPPGTVVLGEEPEAEGAVWAPPPPPGIDEGVLMAAPPPPPAPAAAEEFAPAPPPDSSEPQPPAEEDEFVPPPPPPGAINLDE